MTNIYEAGDLLRCLSSCKDLGEIIINAIHKNTRSQKIELINIYEAGDLLRCLSSCKNPVDNRIEECPRNTIMFQ